MQSKSLDYLMPYIIIFCQEIDQGFGVSHVFHVLHYFIISHYLYYGLDFLLKFL